MFKAPFSEEVCSVTSATDGVSPVQAINVGDCFFPAIALGDPVRNSVDVREAQNEETPEAESSDIDHLRHVIYVTHWLL